MHRIIIEDRGDDYDMRSKEVDSGGGGEGEGSVGSVKVGGRRNGGF